MIKNIVNEIQREIRAHGKVQINENFLNFYVNLLMLDPNWEISKDVLFIRKELQCFIDYVVKNNTDGRNLEILTCKLQYCFEDNFDALPKLPSLKRKRLMKYLSPLKRRSLSKQNNSSNSIDVTVLYITLASGLGNPKDIKVFKETEKALRSMWSEIDQLNFFNENISIRQEMLDYILTVTSGIRLYNMDCKKGGHGIQPLPNLLPKAIDSVDELLTKMSFHLSVKMDYLQTVLMTCYGHVVQNSGVLLYCKIKDPYLMTKLEYNKDLHIFYCYFDESLSKLCEAISQVKKTAETTIKEYSATLKILHETVIPDLYIPCSKIFPVFKRLYGCWVNIQDQVITLAGIKDIFDNMLKVMISLDYHPQEIEGLICQVSSPIPEVNLQTQVHSETEVFNERHLSMIHSTRFEFHGYCVWYLVSTNGILIKGTDDVDIVQYRQKLFKFSSSWGLQSFIRDPDYYINNAYQLARNKPQLILILNLRDRLQEVSSVKQLVFERKVAKDTRHVEIQTETHPIPSNIDVDYEWNIWHRRKKLLEMATYTHCTSKKTQTEKYSFISDQHCQTYRMKETATQTSVYNYTNTPKMFNYICGLRGRKDEKQVQLTGYLPEITHNETECMNKR